MAANVNRRSHIQKPEDAERARKFIFNVPLLTRFVRSFTPMLCAADWPPILTSEERKPLVDYLNSVELTGEADDLKKRLKFASDQKLQLTEEEAEVLTKDILQTCVCEHIVESIAVSIRAGKQENQHKVVAVVAEELETAREDFDAAVEVL